MTKKKKYKSVARYGKKRAILHHTTPMWPANFPPPPLISELPLETQLVARGIRNLYAVPETIIPTKVTPFVLSKIADLHIINRISSFDKISYTDEEHEKLNYINTILTEPHLSKESLETLGTFILEAHPYYYDVDEITIADSPISTDTEQQLVVKRVGDEEKETYSFLNPTKKTTTEDLTEEEILDIDEDVLIKSDHVEAILSAEFAAKFLVGEYKTLSKFAEKMIQVGIEPKIRSFQIGDNTYVKMDALSMVKDKDGVFVWVSDEDFAKALTKAIITNKTVKTSSLEDLFLEQTKYLPDAQREFAEKYAFVPDPAGFGLFLKGTLPKSISLGKLSRLTKMPSELSEDLVEVDLQGTRKMKVQYSTKALKRAKEFLGPDAKFYQSSEGFLVMFVPSSPKIKLVVPPIIDESKQTIDFENILTVKGVALTTENGTTKKELTKSTRTALQQIRKKSFSKDVSDRLELLALQMYETGAKSKEINFFLKDAFEKSNVSRDIPKSLQTEPIQLLKELMISADIIETYKTERKALKKASKLEAAAEKIWTTVSQRIKLREENELLKKLGKDTVPGRDTTMKAIIQLTADAAKLQKETNDLHIRIAETRIKEQPYDARRRQLQIAFDKLVLIHPQGPDKFFDELKENIKDDLELTNYLTGELVFIKDEREIRAPGEIARFNKRIKRKERKAKKMGISEIDILRQLEVPEQADLFKELTGDN